MVPEHHPPRGDFMKTLRNRLGKLVKMADFRRSQSWCADLTDEELEEQLRELTAELKGCRPEEVDMSPKAIEKLLAELQDNLAHRDSD
jgi:hypothetical protein